MQTCTRCGRIGAVSVSWMLARALGQRRACCAEWSVPGAAAQGTGPATVGEYPYQRDWLRAVPDILRTSVPDAASGPAAGHQAHEADGGGTVHGRKPGAPGQAGGTHKQDEGGQYPASWTRPWAGTSADGWRWPRSDSPGWKPCMTVSVLTEKARRQARQRQGRPLACGAGPQIVRCAA